MRKHFLILLVAALTVVTGCKKDNDKPDPTNPGATKVLKRILETENGVTTTYSFSYDAGKRLKAITSNTGQEATVFTYDNSGNVVKMENKVDDVTNIFDFTYTNDIPVSGSFKSFEKVGTEDILTESYDLAYTVTNGVVSKIVALMQDPEDSEETYEVEYDLTYNNGNLTQIVSAGIMSYAARFTYGSKKPVYPAVFKYVMDPAGFSAQFFARNDVLTITYDYASAELDNVIANEYTYDAQGYVLTANDGQTQSRFEYE